MAAGFGLRQARRLGYRHARLSTVHSRTHSRSERPRIAPRIVMAHRRVLARRFVPDQTIVRLVHPLVASCDAQVASRLRRYHTETNHQREHL